MKDTDLILVGPVEAIDRRQNSLRVLGQTIQPETGRVVPREIQVGTMVSVRGKIAADGMVLSSEISAARSNYVPGSTQVLLRGRVARINRQLGTVRIGQVSVDYTSTLYSFDAGQIAVGSIVLFSGIQPSSRGVVLADSALANVSSGLSVSSIGGSDASSIGGSDVNSIGGSDLSSIGGSDVNSIGGSDLSSIGGSDVNSIGGSDLNSISGSDLG